jgi:cytoskeletal protein CcmA (bactofilin family)
VKKNQCEPIDAAAMRNNRHQGEIMHEPNGAPGALCGSDERVTYLGSGVDLKGTVVLRGTIRVDCRIEGDIYAMGTLEVGEQGVIEGTVHTRILFNSGTIQGTIVATEKICLLKLGRLIGEVHTPLFTVEEGARFQGISHMAVGRADQEMPAPDDSMAAVSSHQGPIALLES